jgi:streptogramin lyase/predicted Ser/Thr protein kinase
MVDERIGAVIAGYRIGSVLGQGGMGTVYLAEQPAPRRKVALKLLRHELSSDEAFRRRFEHESETAASTEHPNIVPIYSAGEADGTLYIAMRYVEGTDLRDLIATEGPLPPDRAVAIVSQIAGALDAAHRRGLVHRDVKPGNVLLDTGENAYLSDFGLINRSEVDTALTKTGQFMGSIEYCAPEQIRGEPVDGRADVYSLGCVLYECLTGRPPFKRETEVATLYAHLEEAPPSLGVPGGELRDLEPVIAKAMAKAPADRYATAGEFAKAARHALGQTSGERETAAARPRRRRLVAVAGLVVLAAIAVLAAVTLSGGDGEVAREEPNPTIGVVPDTAIRIDPETGEVVQSITGFDVESLGPRDGGFAAGEGGVWVGSPPNVYHLDPVTSSVRASVTVGGVYSFPAVGFRAIWVANEHALAQVNPATDEILGTVALTSQEAVFSAPDVDAAEGAVWVLQENLLFRIDPISGRIDRQVDLGGTTGMGVGEGGVWVIDGLAGTLTVVDPQTMRVRSQTQLPGSLDDVVAGGGAVWVLDAEAGIVSEVDPTTLEIRGTVRVGDAVRQIAFGAEAVWLADGVAGSVSRIDLLTERVSSFPMPGPVANVAIDPETDEVWILVGTFITEV